MNRLCAEADLSLPDAPGDLFLQLLESAADHEENVPRVNRLAFRLAASLKLECRLQLRLEIVHAAHRHFSFLHQLQ